MHRSNSVVAASGERNEALEARKIVLEILARAEQERLQFAEAEARRGIDWEQQR